MTPVTLSYESAPAPPGLTTEMESRARESVKYLFVPSGRLLVVWFDMSETVPVRIPDIFVDESVFIVIESIVPPSTLSPLIWFSDKDNVPEETSSVFPVPIFILLVAIVAPSIVPPLISGVVRTLLVSVCEPVNDTTVLSIDISVPVLVNPVPALTLSDPENCENTIGNTPILIFSVVTTYPE